MSDSYWLCCGSKDRNHVENCCYVQDECHRWGTNREHAEWMHKWNPPPGSVTPIPAEFLGKVATVLPTDAATREQLPMCTGVLDYFPLALAAVAHLSLTATQQHHPGKPMHWDRNKSLGHADKILKHLADRGTFDTDGVRHSAKLAWRALALLQTEIEAEGGRPGRASKFTTEEI